MKRIPQLDAIVKKPAAGEVIMLEPILAKVRRRACRLYLNAEQSTAVSQSGALEGIRDLPEAIGITIFHLCLSLPRLCDCDTILMLKIVSSGSNISLFRGRLWIYTRRSSNCSLKRRSSIGPSASSKTML
jgi:hypothetical protein